MLSKTRLMHRHIFKAIGECSLASSVGCMLWLIFKLTVIISSTVRVRSDLDRSFAFDEQDLALDDVDVSNNDASFSLDEIMQQKSINGLDTSNLDTKPPSAAAPSNGTAGMLLLGPLLAFAQRAMGINDDDDIPALMNSLGQESMTTTQQSSSHVFAGAYIPPKSAA